MSVDDAINAVERYSPEADHKKGLSVWTWLTLLVLILVGAFLYIKSVN